jgi:predicted amidohydrolase YtcJ
MNQAVRFLRIATLGLCLAAPGCTPEQRPPEDPADLILTHGRVYTFTWDDPAPDGAPAVNAPHQDSGWQPDAEAIAVKAGRILHIGTNEEVQAYRAESTRVIDLQGATALPGLVDSHAHIARLGAIRQQVSLADLATEEAMVKRVAARAATVPEGRWIVGYGWDEGAWADDYPTMALLSAAVPNHPVLLRGRLGFAVWGNRLAFQRAGITRDTVSPSGGEILKDINGNPTGVLLNRATSLLEAVLPSSDTGGLEEQILAGLEEMATSGYVMVDEAGADSATTEAYENLANRYRLPIRVSLMLSARDQELMRVWLARGPDTLGGEKLFVRSVTARYDGELGSRGARLMEGYADRPGHFGVAGAEYGFDETLLANMMRGGFQISVEATGDAGNCEALNFMEWAIAATPTAVSLRHRIEHAQVIQPEDFARFAELGITASVQPTRAVEDFVWAQDRLGPERIQGAHAWRTLRLAGVPLVLGSDSPGSRHDIFYGLHAAITRRDEHLQPPGGWYPEQRLTPEEAIRGYTTWAARANLLDLTSGKLFPGGWADITVMDIDPLVVGSTEPGKLLGGKILLTVVGGQVAFMR